MHAAPANYPCSVSSHCHPTMATVSTSAQTVPPRRLVRNSGLLQLALYSLSA